MRKPTFPGNHGGMIFKQSEVCRSAAAVSSSPAAPTSSSFALGPIRLNTSAAGVNQMIATWSSFARKRSALKKCWANLSRAAPSSMANRAAGLR